MYSIIEINGGIGKSIMGTAIVDGIKKKYPDREILVITGYPVVFLNNPKVFRVFRHGNCPYFYDEYVRDKDVMFFCDEPYRSQGYLAQKEHLIHSWGGILDVECEINPELYLTPVEEDIVLNRLKLNKPMMIFQPFGGPSNQGHSWNRDIPVKQAQEIANRLSQFYHVIQPCVDNQLQLQNCEHVNMPLRELFVLIKHAEYVVGIDSVVQHARKAFGKTSTVCWVTNTPLVFGYEENKNIFPNKEKFLSNASIDGYLNEYDFSGSRKHDFPFEDSNIFDVQEILETVPLPTTLPSGTGEVSIRDDIINIRMDSWAIGDEIAWMPIIEEYRKKTGKTVLVSTFFNKLFSPVYPDIVFCLPNNILSNIDRIYLGVSVDNNKDNPFSHPNWRAQPLQKVASDVLGLDYEPTRPKVHIPSIDIPHRNYICISEHTSRKSKYWHRPNGWQDVVDYCNSVGVNVIVCSKEPTDLKGVIDRTGDHPIENRSALINGARAYIGVSSGLYWIAQAVNTPSLLISGSTDHDHEHVWNGHRISAPEGKCSGCINNPKYNFNDELDCPENKDYECSREITSELVISKLKEVLWEEDTYVFDVKNEKDAKEIILTPTSSVSTDERWEKETEILKEEFKKTLELDGKKVMDYGCGIGRLSKELVELSEEVHGVDISRDMLKLAKDYVDSDKFHPKHVSEIEDEKYDVVICSWVLQHINNVEETIDMIKDKLNDGGQLFVLNNEGVDAIPKNGRWGLRKSSIKEYLDKSFKTVRVYVQKEIDKDINSFIGIYHKEV